MSLRDIPEAHWQEFLDQLSRGHRAWLVTVDRLGPGAERPLGVAERPLGSVSAVPVTRGARGIQIQFQQDSRASEPIRIEGPVRLRVDENEEGAPRSLEIEDDEGQRTRITFRVPSPPGILDGVAPGEI